MRTTIEYQCLRTIKVQNRICETQQIREIMEILSWRSMKVSLHWLSLRLDECYNRGEKKEKECNMKMGTITNPFKDQSFSLTKTLLPWTPMALLPIALLCIYFYPPFFTPSPSTELPQSSPITSHSSSFTCEGICMHHFILLKLE